MRPRSLAREQCAQAEHCATARNLVSVSKRRKYRPRRVLLADKPNDPYKPDPALRELRKLTEQSFNSAKARCRNPKGWGYAQYGAKGITFSSEWNSFRQFVADMGLRPSAEHSLDRIDNAKGYEYGNCRWATRKEQAANKGTKRQQRRAREKAKAQLLSHLPRPELSGEGVA